MRRNVRHMTECRREHMRGEPHLYLADQVRRNLRALVERAQHHHDHIKIMRYGKIIAVLVPVEWHEQAQQALEKSQGGTPQ